MTASSITYLQLEQQKERIEDKKYLRNNVKYFQNLMENTYIFEDIRCSKDIKQRKGKNTQSEAYHCQWLKAKDKEQNLKVTRGS